MKPGKNAAPLGCIGSFLKIDKYGEDLYVVGECFADIMIQTVMRLCCRTCVCKNQTGLEDKDFSSVVTIQPKAEVSIFVWGNR